MCIHMVMCIHMCIHMVQQKMYFPWERTVCSTYNLACGSWPVPNATGYMACVWQYHSNSSWAGSYGICSLPLTPTATTHAPLTGIAPEVWGSKSSWKSSMHSWNLPTTSTRSVGMSKIGLFSCQWSHSVGAGPLLIWSLIDWVILKLIPSYSYFKGWNGWNCVCKLQVYLSLNPIHKHVATCTHQYRHI